MKRCDPKNPMTPPVTESRMYPAVEKSVSPSKRFQLVQSEDKMFWACLLFFIFVIVFILAFALVLGIAHHYKIV
uniref:Uncharacterized protein n=1 Tax=Caenorhabditis tropicalis TaxID=1561998 RepID=A0A1I7UV70_9PELO